MGVEKWTISEISLHELDNGCWSVDIDSGDERLEIIIVFGRSKQECLSRANRICKVNEMEAILERVFTATNIGEGISNRMLRKMESLLKDMKQ